MVVIDSVRDLSAAFLLLAATLTLFVVGVAVLL